MKNIKMLKDSLKEELDATIGVTGSGTVACRLWHTLNNVRLEMEKCARLDAKEATDQIVELKAQLAIEKTHVKELKSIIRQLKHGLD